MKLIRIGPDGKEKPGIITEDGRRLEVSTFGEDYDQEFFGSDGPQRLNNWLEHNFDSCPTVGEEVRLGPPIAQVSKIICVGLNYAMHAKEGGMDIPTEPVLFFKATTAICGPFDDVIIPKASTKTDWEVELAVVIGKKGNYISETDAVDHIAGYVLHRNQRLLLFLLQLEFPPRHLISSDTPGNEQAGS